MQGSKHCMYIVYSSWAHWQWGLTDEDQAVCFIAEWESPLPLIKPFVSGSQLQKALCVLSTVPSKACLAYNKDLVAYADQSKQASYRMLPEIVHKWTAAPSTLYKDLSNFKAQNIC